MGSSHAVVKEAPDYIDKLYMARVGEMESNNGLRTAEPGNSYAGPWAEKFTGDANTSHVAAMWPQIAAVLKAADLPVLRNCAITETRALNDSYIKDDINVNALVMLTIAWQIDKALKKYNPKAYERLDKDQKHAILYLFYNVPKVAKEVLDNLPDPKKPWKKEKPLSKIITSISVRNMMAKNPRVYPPNVTPLGLLAHFINAVDGAAKRAMSVQSVAPFIVQDSKNLESFLDHLLPKLPSKKSIVSHRRAQHMGSTAARPK